VHDPEGNLSTLPAIGTALLGVFTATFLKWKSKDFSMRKKAIALFAVGVVLLLLGLLWDMDFPINKRLWTSSFVVYVGGWSLILLSIFYFIIDVLEWKKWSFPFIIIGINSIVIYMAAEGMINFAHTSNYIFGGLINFAAVTWQPVIAAASVTFVQLVMLYFLYRNKLFLKI
jgi:predicted acyltransferase